MGAQLLTPWLGSQASFCCGFLLLSKGPYRVALPKPPLCWGAPVCRR